MSRYRLQISPGSRNFPAALDSCHPRHGDQAADPGAQSGDTQSAPGGDVGELMSRQRSVRQRDLPGARSETVQPGLDELPGRITLGKSSLHEWIERHRLTGPVGLLAPGKRLERLQHVPGNPQSDGSHRKLRQHAERQPIEGTRLAGRVGEHREAAFLRHEGFVHFEIIAAAVPRMPLVSHA